jgi:hypothetical protein
MKKIHFYSTPKALKNLDGRTVICSACTFSAEYGEIKKDRVQINTIDEFGLISDRTLWNECTSADIQHWLSKGLIKEYNPLNYPNFIKVISDECTPSDILIPSGRYRLLEQNFFITLDNIDILTKEIKISKRDFSTLYKTNHVKFLTSQPISVKSM